MKNDLVKFSVPIERVEDLLDANFAVFVDVSSSMTERDAGELGNESRYAVMQRAISRLYGLLNGKVVLVWFSSTFGLCASDMLPGAHGCTDIAGPLAFLHQYGFDAFLDKAVLISDGEPTDGLPSPEEASCAAAAQLACPLDVVYVGPRDGYGEQVLRKIAKAGRGEYIYEVLTAPEKLAQKIMLMLTMEKE